MIYVCGETSIMLCTHSEKSQTNKCMFHSWWATTITNSTTIYHLFIVFLWVGERAALGKGFEIAAFKLRRFFESLILLRRPEGGASMPLSKDCA